MGTSPAFPIRWGANSRPDVREYDLSGSADFPWGAAVYLSSGEVTECATDDTTILGFADEASADVIVPGKVRVVLPNDQTEFEMACSSTPSSSNVYPAGGPYGLTVDADGDPIIDLTDTTNDAFIITALTDRGTAAAQVISAARQAPA